MTDLHDLSIYTPTDIEDVRLCIETPDDGFTYALHQLYTYIRACVEQGTRPQEFIYRYHLDALQRYAEDADDYRISAGICLALAMTDGDNARDERRAKNRALVMAGLVAFKLFTRL